MGGAILGLGAGLVGGLVVVVIALFQKPRTCPDCGTRMPKFRKPANRRQMLWGGWTCPACWCEVDRRGRKVSGKQP